MGNPVVKLAEGELGRAAVGLRRDAMRLGEKLADDGAARNILGRDVSVLTSSAGKRAGKAASAAEKPWTGEVMKLFAALGETVKGKPQISLNQEIGAAREDLVMGELKRLFPSRNGFHILRQPYLRDAGGAIAHDAKTGEARRLDFAVYRGRRVVRSLEVTSQTARKVDQMAKEARIRQHGGTFVKDMESGDLIRVPAPLKTRVYRIQ